MAGNKSYTIVEYFGGDDGYRCGYCKNEKGNFSHGKCVGRQAEAGLRALGVSELVSANDLRSTVYLLEQPLLMAAYSLILL